MDTENLERGLALAIGLPKNLETMDDFDHLMIKLKLDVLDLARNGVDDVLIKSLCGDITFIIDRQKACG